MSVCPGFSSGLSSPGQNGTSNGDNVRTLRLPGVLLTLVVIGCGGNRNPFQDRGDRQQIMEVQAYLLNLAFESHEPPTNVFPEVVGRTPICLGVGQRGIYSNRFWLSQNPREERWDPGPALLRRLEGAPGPIVPLSDCLRDGNDRERMASDGSPAVTWFVSNPSWTTPNSASVAVTIRGLGRYDMRYSAALRRIGGTWQVHRFTCMWANALCEHFR